mmetsp:Transcript_4672/g.6911  ORF Transcript_4672/g.6911 Transcript_4672/m.6911 type:complete len:173 (+) Transcript_4672:44-562(+)
MYNQGPYNQGPPQQQYNQGPPPQQYNQGGQYNHQQQQQGPSPQEVDLNEVMKIAKGFSQHYYGQFSGNRRGLFDLYTDNATMSWSGKFIVGRVEIAKHLDGVGPKAVTFKKLRFEVNDVDAQRSTSGGILVFVSGTMLPDEEERPLPFGQTFNLEQINNSFLITNDIFRLIL